MCGMEVNIHSTLCIEPVEVYVVNTKTLQKLLVKRYPDTYHIMQQSAMMLLRHRLNRIGAVKVKSNYIIETHGKVLFFVLL